MYQHSSHSPAPPSLFTEPPEWTATMKIHAGAPLPLCKPTLCLPWEFTKAGSHPWGISAQNPQLEGGEHVPDPDCDLPQIKATRASVGRAEGKIDLHDIS